MRITNTKLSVSTLDTLTAADLAEILNVTENAIYGYVKNGVLPAPFTITDGPKGHLRWRVSAISEWMHQRETKAAETVKINKSLRAQDSVVKV